jgi:hypothetical protein
MLYGLSGELLLLVPTARTTMEFDYECGLALAEAIPQHLGKEVVIAIPMSLIIQGHQKEIRML